MDTLSTYSRDTLSADLFARDEDVRRYWRRAYGAAFAVVRRHALAEDLAQQAFLVALQALRRGLYDERRGPFGAWITSIARREALCYVGSPKAREQGLPDGYAAMPTRRPGPLRSLLEAEAARAIEGAIKALTPKMRAVVVPRVSEGLTFGEIAAALDVPVATVLSRRVGARRRLRVALNGLLPVRRRKGRFRTAGRPRAQSARVRGADGRFVPGGR